MIMIFKTQTLIIIDDDIDIKKRSHSFYVSPYVQERRFSYHISRARLEKINLCPFFLGTWRQSQPSASLRTTSNTESMSSAP